MSDPVAAAPTTGHELLLGLAGWVDDDLLGIGRELVAVGEETVALELLTASLSAARTVLPYPVRDGLADAVERRLGPEFARLLPQAGPQPDGTEHLFVPDPPFAGPGAPDLVERIGAVVAELPVVARSRARTSLTWRLTPAGTSPGPVPHPVLLAVLDDPGPAEVLAYQLGAALARTGVPVSVESFVENRPLPPYQRAALAASRPLSAPVPNAVTLPVLPATAAVPDDDLLGADDIPDPAPRDAAGDEVPTGDETAVDRLGTGPDETDRAGVDDAPGAGDRSGVEPGSPVLAGNPGHDDLAPDDPAVPDPAAPDDDIPDDDVPGLAPPGPVRMAPPSREPGRIDPARIDPGRFDPARRSPNGVAGDEAGPPREAVWTDPADLPHRPRPEAGGSERPGTPSPGPSDPRPGPIPGDRPYDGPNGHPAPRPAPRRPFRPMPPAGEGPSGGPPSPGPGEPGTPPNGLPGPLPGPGPSGRPPNGLTGPPPDSGPPADPDLGAGSSDPLFGADLPDQPPRPARPGPAPRSGPAGETGPARRRPESGYGLDRPLTPPVNGHGPPPGEQAWNQQWSTGSWAIASGPLPGQDPDIEPATSPTPSTPPSGSFPQARRTPSPGPSGTGSHEPDPGLPETGLREPEWFPLGEDGADGTDVDDPRPRHRLDLPDTDDEADAAGSPGPVPAGPSPSAVPDHGLDSRLTPNEQELLRRLQEELAAREGGEPPSSPRNGRPYPGGD